MVIIFLDKKEIIDEKDKKELNIFLKPQFDLTMN